MYCDFCVDEYGESNRVKARCYCPRCGKAGCGNLHFVKPDGCKVKIWPITGQEKGPGI